MNDVMNEQNENVTRRESLRKMGVAAAAAAIGLAGAKAMAADDRAADGAVRPPKVLLLNGSPRPDGNTFMLLSEIKEQLKKHDVEGEIFQIGTRAVRGCIDCGQCHSRRLGRCAFDDDVTDQLIERMSGCDALIVGSPVYYGMPTGQVVAALQRMSYSAGGVLNGKPAAAVAVCRRGGATASLQTLQMAFQLFHMPIVTSRYWNIAYGAAKGEVAKDREGLQTMRSLADDMARVLRKFAAKT